MTYVKKLVKIGHVVLEIYSRADRHTDRQTDMVITMLRSAIGGRVKNGSYTHTKITSQIFPKYSPRGRRVFDFVIASCCSKLRTGGEVCCGK